MVFRPSLRPGIVLGLVWTALGLGGCGSTTVHHVTVTRTVSGPGTGTTSSSSSSSLGSRRRRRPATAGAALSGRSPRAVVDAAARALGAAGGFAMSVDLRQAGTRIRIALTSGGGQTYDATVDSNRAVSEIINLPSRTYLRGNRSFWSAQAGHSAAARARAGELANQWLRLTGPGRRAARRMLGSLAPGTLARCLTEDHGTLRLAGVARVDGTPAVIVRDLGNAPGATPSTLAVAATGRSYPLRYTATGPTRPGGRVDACNDGRGGSALGTIRLSRFGAIGPIEPPEGARPGAGAGGGALT